MADGLPKPLANNLEFSNRLSAVGTQAGIAPREGGFTVRKFSRRMRGLTARVTRDESAQMPAVHHEPVPAMAATKPDCPPTRQHAVRIPPTH
jgi:hypothetical protein